MVENERLIAKVENVVSKVDKLEEKMSKVEATLEKLDRNMDKISFYLENDPKTNRKGIVEKIDELNIRLEKQDHERKVFKAQATIAGGIGAIILTGLTKIFPYILTILQK